MSRWHLHYALEVWADHPVLAHGWLQLGVTNRSRLTVGLLEYESMLVWTHFPGRCLLQKDGPSGRWLSNGFRRLAPHLAHGGCKQSLHFHLFRCCFFVAVGNSVSFLMFLQEAHGMSSRSFPVHAGHRHSCRLWYSLPIQWGRGASHPSSQQDGNLQASLQ